ncbi:hypothetical protein K437DRAFT_243795 [Tilletiaria anomala UBC 951]|uniref:Yeast cell wall synthesis Kre9/Knh1-like N-terminal domain-containing protein n=1 Tax=Tilletiaria anomala (strain ATCC 24038 / CBS 436.72 / UBC 951) TaxID=1037660 RepID=A0A066WF18_TILAU|nr:uncharacterized protein K437DRAFT_243795 [Tilletiaria anomala UBC 951]KDN52331.1 hypothetical protein K437DRAFT_243795 [Tilletiaria anomala UBC 951]
MQLATLLAFTSFAATAVTASPLPDRISTAGIDGFVARGLSAQHAGAWDSIQLQRSPADPENAKRDEKQTLAERIVYNPHITSPAGGEVWTAGSQQTVTWDTSDLPAELEHATSMLKLGFEPADGSGGLNEKWTLADDFPTRAGTVSFTLPTDLETRNDYIVVLFGDSGNASPHFTINATPAAMPRIAKASDDGVPADAEGLLSKNVSIY